MAFGLVLFTGALTLFSIRGAQMGAIVSSVRSTLNQLDNETIAMAKENLQQLEESGKVSGPQNGFTSS